MNTQEKNTERVHKEDNQLAVTPIPKLVVALALPAIISQIVNLLYNIVDRMFIGRIPGTGALALTSVGLCLPIITLITSFTYLVSMGAAPLASIAMGAGDNKRAEKIMGNSCFLLIIIAIILTAVLTIFPNQILTLFASSEETMEFAHNYLTVYALGTIFVQLTLGLIPFMTAQGFTKESMIAVIIGAIINIALDPVFIFLLGWGVAGAAAATILAQGVSCLYVIRFLTGKKTFLKLKVQNLKPDIHIISKSLGLGLSPFIMISTESLLLLCFNWQLMRFGGSLAVGAMTILTSVLQFGTMPLSGLTQGVQPIVSFNFGAGNMDRVKQAFKILLITSLVYTTFIWIVSELSPQMIASIFTNSPELINMCTWSLRVYMGGYALMGAQLACQQTLLALGKAKISIFLAMLRKIILLIPFIFLFPAFMPDKLLAVFLAEPAADIIAILTTCIMFYISFPKILKQHSASKGDIAHAH